MEMFTAYRVMLTGETGDAIWANEYKDYATAYRAYCKSTQYLYVTGWTLRLDSYMVAKLDNELAKGTVPLRTITHCAVIEGGI